MNNYLIMIPARGGSKGIKKKNIYPICNKPMIYYTLSLLKKIKWDKDVVISTDNDEIISVVKSLIDGLNNYIIIRRPDEFAMDSSSTEDVAFHTIRYMKEKFGKEYNALITMAPNLPLRTTDMFLKCIKSFEDMPDYFDSQVCFCRTSEDLWKKTDKNEYIRLFPNAPRRRQDREPLFIEKGSITITKISALKRTGSLWGNKIYGFEMNEIYGVDVHDNNDIGYLEYLISNNIVEVK